MSERWNRGTVNAAMFVADSEPSDTSTVDLADNEYCSETTLRSSMVHYDDSIHEVCDDDHPTRGNWVPNTSPTPSKTG